MRYRSYKIRKYLLFLILSVLLGLSGCTSGLSTEQESGEVVSASEETTEKEGLTEDDENILSDVEKKNIEKIVALEKQYKEKHILQEPLAFGMEYSFDLDGDGTPETLCLRYKSMENDRDYAVEVLINGKCVMGADEWVVTLETRGYYVTDIDEKNPGLEIAISDNGHSDDPKTCFFIYDGSLKYIGSVDNMMEEQYTEKNKILTGFNGKVAGIIRADVFYSCFAYAQWQYSYQDKTIQMMEQDMYELCPDKSYELTEDIQIYKQKSTDSKCITLKAQNVYFLESDRDLWMKVKGEDGVTGYLYRNEDWDVDGTGKHAEEIFVNLPFFG